MEQLVDVEVEKCVNVPKLRFPEFKGRWEMKDIIGLGKLIGGGTPSTSISEFWRGNVAWVSSSDLSEDSFEIRPTRYITDQAIKESSTKLVPPKSILIVSRVGVGKIAINESNICTSQDFINIDPYIDDHYFLAYLFKTKLKVIIGYNQGTSIKGFVKSDFEKLQFKLPSLPEQTKIASFLTSVDEKLQVLKKKKRLLEEYKKGVMQKLFSQELRFKDENGNEFPEWEMQRFIEVAIFFSGGTPLSTNKNNFNGNIPFIRSGEINSFDTEQYLSTEGYKNSSAKLIVKGDLLYALYGATSGEVAISKMDGAINQAILCIRPSQIDNRYVKFFLEHYKLKITKTYLQGGQGNLSAEIIKSLILPIPTSNEISNIIQILTIIEVRDKILKQQIIKLESWKKGLLQKMFC